MRRSSRFNRSRSRSGLAGSPAPGSVFFSGPRIFARKEAAARGIPGKMFSILEEKVCPEEAPGHWTEIERYRDIEDTERLVFMRFGRV